MHKKEKKNCCLFEHDLNGITYDFIKIIYRLTLGIQLKQGINIACCKLIC